MDIEREIKEEDGYSYTASYKLTLLWYRVFVDTSSKNLNRHFLMRLKLTGVYVLLLQL